MDLRHSHYYYYKFKGVGRIQSENVFLYSSGRIINFISLPKIYSLQILLLKEMSKKPGAYIRQICEQTGKNFRELKSLDMSNVPIFQFSTELKNKFQQNHNLIDLTLVDCKIQSLANMPYLPKLQNIDLTANSITDIDIKYLIQCHRLKVIGLAANNIMKIQVFYEFKTLDNLEELELSGNPVADLEEYHETAFKVIEALRSLDGYDIEGKVTFELSDYSQDLINELEQNQDSDNDTLHSEKNLKKKAQKKKKNVVFDNSSSDSYESPIFNYSKGRR